MPSTKLSIGMVGTQPNIIQFHSSLQFLFRLPVMIVSSILDYGVDYFACEFMRMVMGTR